MFRSTFKTKTDPPVVETAAAQQWVMPAAGAAAPAVVLFNEKLSYSNVSETESNTAAAPNQATTIDQVQGVETTMPATVATVADTYSQPTAESPLSFHADDADLTDVPDLADDFLLTTPLVSTTTRIVVETVSSNEEEQDGVEDIVVVDAQQSEQAAALLRLSQTLSHETAPTLKKQDDSAAAAVEPIQMFAPRAEYSTAGSEMDLEAPPCSRNVVLGNNNNDDDGPAPVRKPWNLRSMLAVVGVGIAVVGVFSVASVLFPTTTTTSTPVVVPVSVPVPVEPVPVQLEPVPVELVTSLAKVAPSGVVARATTMFEGFKSYVETTEEVIDLDEVVEAPTESVIEPVVSISPQAALPETALPEPIFQQPVPMPEQAEAWFSNRTKAKGLLAFVIFMIGLLGPSSSDSNGKKIKTESAVKDEATAAGDLTKFTYLKRFLAKSNFAGKVGRQSRSPAKKGAKALNGLENYQNLTVEDLKSISHGFGGKATGNKADLIVSVAKSYKNTVAEFKNDQIKKLLLTKGLSDLGKKQEMVDRLVEAGF